jgi:CRISPR-associated protein Cmr3
MEPLDVLFFRDGRPFGAATRAQSGQPQPQTLAGAVWTALLQQHGCRFDVMAKEVRKIQGTPTQEQWAGAVTAAGAPPWIARLQMRGPWLARGSRDSLDVLTPVPAILHTAKKAGEDQAPLHRLNPLPRRQQPPGWEPVEEGLRPLWIKHRDPTEAATGYLTRKGLQTFLSGGEPDPDELVKAKDLFDFDHRTGIEIAADPLTAKEGGIYGISLLALKPNVSLYAEVMLPGEAPPDALEALSTFAFGGEGRRVAVEPCGAYAWPTASPNRERQKPLVMLTTPGLFRAGWKPKALDEYIVAAAVPGAVAISGWDLARGGPKPTRFAAQAGSVYFLDSLPPNLLEGALADAEADQVQGWGCYVKGVWTDE